MKRQWSHLALLSTLLLSTTAHAGDVPATMGASVRPAERWSWIGANGGTYWYVPTPNLLAFQWNPDDPESAAAVNDQTVWHIERYDNGYFFGPAAAQVNGGPVMCQYMIGSITPNGRVYIAFNSQPAQGSPTITSGTGEMAATGDAWAFNMQMSTGNDQRQVAHWAYMMQCHEGEACWHSLPGSNASITSMLAACDGKP